MRTRARRVVIGLGAAVLLAASATSGAFAGAGTGCAAVGNPGDNPGLRDMQLMSLSDAVLRSMAQLTDAWYAANSTSADQTYADRLASAGVVDKNGDGLVCIAEHWGEPLNPHSHWVLVFAGLLSNPSEPQSFLVADNHMGTAKG
jgi:hypothetical protein